MGKNKTTNHSFHAIFEASKVCLFVKEKNEKGKKSVYKNGLDSLFKEFELGLIRFFKVKTVLQFLVFYSICFDFLNKKSKAVI